MKSSVLDKAYRKERNAFVNERLLHIIRISADKQHIELVASELHKSRAWAYKWYKRYNEEGLEGLRDKPRSGRRPELPLEVEYEIREILKESITGWTTKQVEELIIEESGIRYHHNYIYYIVRKWGFKHKVPRKVLVNTASKEEKEDFKKRPARF